MTETQITTSYDEVPYESHPFPQSHPDRLATIGRIFGMNPADIKNCRVLELGCASGGNLIPMAAILPQSEFIGIDVSSRQVGMGRKIINDLELENIRLENVSILDVDQSWGLFDYIICHGVYSWVPSAVQEKIMAICAENLAPQGIAYISYNTYPGWHMREMIRHMMIYHARQFTDNRQKIQQARALIEFLAKSVPTENNHYGMLLKSELELIKRSKDYYLFHDHLEEVNIPLYFYQFAERAAKCGLQYLGEAEFHTMLTGGFPKEVEETLKRISPNIINTEQYMDFLRNRFFRQTLLCHGGIPLRRNLNPPSVYGLLVASSARPVNPEVDINTTKVERFVTREGAQIETGSPVLKTSFIILSEQWPRALTFDDLVMKVREKRGLSSEVEEQTKAEVGLSLLTAYSIRAVEFHTWQANFVSFVSDYPQVSKLAAYLVTMQGKTQVVNLRHELVNLDGIAQNIIGFLNGTKDHKTLLEHLINLTKKGILNINQDGKRVTDEETIRQTLDQALKASLQKMAASALLVK